MRQSAIDHMFTIAEDNDYIEIITTMYKPIVIKKRFISYDYFEYCIRINDMASKDQYMIQLETIEAIKVIIPKFGSHSRKCGEVETKVGA